ERGEDGGVTRGQAGSLLGLCDHGLMTEVAGVAVERSLSVRELEQLVRERAANPEKEPSKAKRQSTPAPMPPDTAIRGIEDDLRRYLQTDVKLKLAGTAKGTLEVTFYSNDDLDRLLQLILRDEHHW